jgi:hypothetical protein
MPFIYRSFSSKIQPISNPSKRNSLPSKIISRRGLSILMLCINISVCILSSSFLVSFIQVSRAMLTISSVWTGLEALGFGANLQHYNPLIDAGVAKQWNLPSEWRLVAQMVFGSPEAGPGEKVQKPVEDRVKIFGKL